jgi:hypothetical protein
MVVSDESTAMDDTTIYDPKKYRPRNYVSDSETSGDFTSVSEFEEKNRNRKRLQRRARSHSFLSSTCDDTDISVQVNLITVELNLNQDREFGLNVMVRKKGNYHEIFVNHIAPSK